MALIDRRKRHRRKSAAPAGSGEPFATIDADRFEEAGSDPARKRVMKAADRYNAASKRRKKD